MKSFSEIAESLGDHLDHEWKIQPLFDTMIVAKSIGDTSTYFRNLKWLWEAHMPKLEDGYHPYFVDWGKLFTPIESAVWQDIRSLPMEFYPQYPVGKRFIDFADPKLKIGIECDGKAFHSREKDVQRDLELMELGWTIYHLKGADCLTEDLDSEPKEQDKRKWMLSSSAGLSRAIFHKYYGGHISEDLQELVHDTLENHIYVWREV